MNPNPIETMSLRVSEFNALVKEVLEAGFPQSLWICGEIQGFDRQRHKTHVFFDLVEKDPISHDVIARIGAVIFARQKPLLQQRLRLASDPFELKDGLEVRFLCRVDFYPPHGMVRLIVEDLDPVYTVGQMALHKQRLIEELKREGVLDANKRRPWPMVPLSIGLITAYDSAAYNDFVTHLRESGYGFRILVRNTIMQGRQCPDDVVAALRFFDRREDIDVIVITRGGGSLADLHAFDNGTIARTIAVCRKPVVSGIGHDINITVTDLASHTTCKTPTALAQCLIDRIAEFCLTCDEKINCLDQELSRYFETQRRRLREAVLHLDTGTRRFLQRHDQWLARAEGRLQRTPLRVLSQHARMLQQRWRRLNSAWPRVLRNASQLLEHKRQAAVLSDPSHWLTKGFSITRDQRGRLLKTVETVSNGQALLTQLRDGTLISRVEGRTRSSSPLSEGS